MTCRVSSTVAASCLAASPLLAVAADLEETRRRLETIHDSLPKTREERSRRDLDHEPATATEMRAVIRNVLANSLEPAIKDLRAATEYRPGKRLKG